LKSPQIYLKGVLERTFNSHSTQTYYLQK